MRVGTALEMRALDRQATARAGVPGLVLMENAGREVARAACEFFGIGRSSRVAVVAGTGNNGGDGLVAARHLEDAGAEVTVAVVGEVGRMQGDALAMLRAWHGRGHAVVPECPQCRYDLVIDALLGTGASGAPRPPVSTAVESINASGRPVLSVDIPTGVDATTGRVEGPVVTADLTVTFGALKPGLLFYPGAEHAGRVLVAGISLPPHLLAELAMRVATPELVRAYLPRRRDDAHKGSHGRVLVIGGSPGLSGAAALAAVAALRAGAGLVTLGIPAPLHDLMEAKLTEVMTCRLDAGADGRVHTDAVPVALARGKEADVVALGPGLGRSPGVAAFVREFLARHGGKSVVDADALRALPPGLELPHAVLTPHPGEAAHLLGCTAGAVAGDRIGAARELARRYGAVVVLKGARTVVADARGALFIDPTATPVLATAGTGDVLTGTIAAQVAQGCPPLEAAVVGVYLHGRAGRLLAERLGSAGALAGEIADALPLARRQVLGQTTGGGWQWDSALS